MQNVFSTCLKIVAMFWCFKILVLAMVTVKICIFCSVTRCSQLDYTVLSQRTVICFMFHSCKLRSLEIISCLSSVLVLWQHVAELCMDVDILYSEYNFKVICLCSSFMQIINYKYCFIVQKLFFFTSTTIPIHFSQDVSAFVIAPFSLFWPPVSTPVVSTPFLLPFVYCHSVWPLLIWL